MQASLYASIDYGIDAGMGEMRKITVHVPVADLEGAQAYTGEGVTETVRAALKKLRSIQAQQELIKLRGKVKFSMTLDELRYDRE
jgi:dihydroxyacetone kinase